MDFLNDENTIDKCDSGYGYIQSFVVSAYIETVITDLLIRPTII